jgi:tripartite ATP-independent transporter DctM subunit
MSCAVFTAFTGASGITIIAMGGILYPLLLHEKYPEDFSLGLVTTSGNLGLLFPPSLPIILYALVAGISLDQLFIAGIVPGMLVLAVLAAYSMYTAQSRKIPVTRFSWRELVRAAHGAAWEIPLPLLIVVGIYTGLFTATEAAAITAFYVFVVEVLVQKDVSLFKGVPQVMKDSMVLVGAILMVIAVAMGLTNFLVDQEVPARMFEFSRVYIGTPIAFLMALNLFLLLVGMMTDTFTAIIVAVPLVIPLARQYSVDPVHLGIVILTNLEIGELTPPIGINLFLSSIRFTKPFFTVVRATFPFICILLVALLAITYVPALSLWLVHLLHVR